MTRLIDGNTQTLPLRTDEGRYDEDKWHAASEYNIQEGYRTTKQTLQRWNEADESQRRSKQALIGAALKS